MFVVVVLAFGAVRSGLTVPVVRAVLVGAMRRGVAVVVLRRVLVCRRLGVLLFLSVLLSFPVLLRVARRR